MGRYLSTLRGVLSVNLGDVRSNAVEEVAGFVVKVVLKGLG